MFIGQVDIAKRACQVTEDRLKIRIGLKSIMTNGSYDTGAFDGSIVTTLTRKDVNLLLSSISLYDWCKSNSDFGELLDIALLEWSETGKSLQEVGTQSEHPG